MRLRFDGRARRLLRRLPVVNVYSVAELLLMAGLAIQGARLVWALVTPAGPLGDWRPAAPVVAGSPQDLLTGFNPFFRLEAPQGPATVTSLQLTLFGTRIDEATGRGSAILAGPDGLQQSISVGEEVAPGVRLKAVAFDHVTLDRGGAEEDLFIDQSGAVAPVAPGAPGTGGLPSLVPVAPPPGAPGISPADAGGTIGVGQIRQEIGFIPRLDDGRVSGLVVRPQGTGEVFRRAGLKEGDVVTAIGGRPVSGPADLDRIAGEFRNGGTIPLMVERGAQTLPLAITVSPSK